MTSGSQVVLRNNMYDQYAGIVLATVLATVCFVGLTRSVRARHASLWRTFRFWPALFAVPALWNNWTISRFGGGLQMVEIKTGVGGPMAGILFLFAAVTLVVVEAYLRERDGFTPSHEGPIDH